MRKNAMPWFTDLEMDCCGRIIDVDMHLEWIDTGKLPNKYEKALERYFKTTNKRKIMYKALNTNRLPIYCDKCRVVELVDIRSGETIKKVAMKNVAKELIKVAKDLVSETAKDEYEKRSKNIIKILKVMEKKLVLHKKEFGKNSTDWGYVGSLGHCEELLEDINRFLN